MSEHILPVALGTRLAGLAARTPSSRDRYIDFLRAFSILVVVVGHWMSTVAVWGESGIKVYNAVGFIPGMWITTWVLQVMPLFFFVGGFSNLVTLDAFRRRGESPLAFLRSRAARLLRPTSLFLGAWILILPLLSLVFHGWARTLRFSLIMLSPLWFLAVYLLMILATPLVRDLHRHYHVWVMAFLAVLIITVDSMRFGLGISGVSWANVIVVWVFVHQLGFFYADGSLLRLPRWGHAVMASGGLASLVVLTNTGVYPRSMVGTGVEKISNMNPPTMCIALLSCWLVGVAMLLRSPVTRWLSRLRPWMAVIAANRLIMTVYLWHLTAYAIVFLLLYPIGLGHQIRNIPLWWLERPVWIILPAIVLAGLVSVFGRFEHSGKV